MSESKNDSSEVKDLDEVIDSSEVGDSTKDGLHDASIVLWDFLFQRSAI